ncbi:hypothetical protein [Pontimicrobium sp. MEBiC01747]
MNYNFKKKNFGSSTFNDYGVDLDSIIKESEYALDGLDWWGWTSEIITESNNLEGEEDYTYQVEGSDFFIAVKKTEVLMWARESTKPDVTWSFNEFIEFMEAFKVFVEENS